MSDDTNTTNVCIIGIGSMGYGMGLSLLESKYTKTVTGFDLNKEAVASFHQKSLELNKNLCSKPATSLEEAIIKNITKIVLLSLVNETQCEEVIFKSLTKVLEKESIIIVTSTVTASWCRSAANRLWEEYQIHFVDCPVSGGPVRAAKGELTMMLSKVTKDSVVMEQIKPLIHAMGSQIHELEGGVGMGSTAKMVHQLLAGVHICAAAEALSLASKSGLNVKQMYDIVNGAAGASWMFQDRGQRMISDSSQEVKSALDIFVKDLGIVHDEAKAVKSSIPLASMALQQFISGQGLGLGQFDDSQVIQVYKALNGSNNSKANSKETN